MLSNKILNSVARISSLGVQLYGGYSRPVEGPTAPNVAVVDANAAWDHQYCKRDYQPRQRNPSIGDPLISIPQSSSESLVEESLLLDLDRWNIGLKIPKRETDSLPKVAVQPKVEENDQHKFQPWMEFFGPVEVNAKEFAKISIDPDADQELDIKAWNTFLNDDTSDLCSEFSVFQGSSPVEKDIKPEPIDDMVYDSIVPETIVKSEPLDGFSVKEEVMTVPRNVVSNRTLYLSPMDLMPLKKRGVKMKPSEDPLTDKRREMNREAASRYRERKREMKMLSVKNSRLRKRAEFLQKEIAMYRRKVYGN